MYQDKTILALIPARGGSKGVPHKNKRRLEGKPLVAWTIAQAKNSKYIDSIVVSSNDREIAEISKKHGAEVPFVRPKRLSSDRARMIDVILHSLKHLERSLRFHHLLILLQPTSPLRTSEDIDSAIELLFKKKAKAIVSVCETEHHPFWANTLPANGCMSNFRRIENANQNRQELPRFYRINGAVYLAYCNYITKVKDFIGKETFAYYMPRERSVDIDTELDFKFAELLLKSIPNK